MAADNKISTVSKKLKRWIPTDWGRLFLCLLSSSYLFVRETQKSPPKVKSVFLEDENKHSVTDKWLSFLHTRIYIFPQALFYHMVLLNNMVIPLTPFVPGMHCPSQRLGWCLCKAAYAGRSCPVQCGHGWDSTDLIDTQYWVNKAAHIHCYYLQPKVVQHPQLTKARWKTGLLPVRGVLFFL